MSDSPSGAPAATPDYEVAEEIVGLAPWLPWPLASWSWWTTPVRAERLALLRICLAACLIADLFFNYVPETLNYFGKDGIGAPANFAWRFRDDRMTWSLLRGPGDSTNMNLGLVLWLAASGWTLLNATASLFLTKRRPAPDGTGISLWLGSLGFAVYVAGLWSHLLAEKAAHDAKIAPEAWAADAIGFAWALGEHRIEAIAWILPLVGISLACLLHFLELLRLLVDPSHRVPWGSLAFTLMVGLSLLIGGLALTQVERVDRESWWMRALNSWQEDDTLLMLAMGIWVGAACFLLLGCFTRTAAILTWMLSMSFGNANPYLDNAGDTIRGILLFYLMLCPCGAVWSFDGLFGQMFSRSHAASTKKLRVFVHPWPICLIFVQMIFIYFMNGIYKLMGDDWLQGNSLHYVLSDMVMTRVSQFMLPIPPALARVMTWTVLVWEVSFPLLVLWKWTRRLALIFGVLFHLGIFASLELAGFVPYALCMYIPMLPWREAPHGGSGTLEK